MKKKISFICVTILLVCAMTLALVGCNKEIEPFAVVDKQTTLSEIWNSWTKENFSVSSDTLGIDLNLTAKEGTSESTLSIKGGLSTKANSKNALSLKMVKKDNGVLADSYEIIIDTEAVYLTNKDGKTTKNTEIFLPSLTDAKVDLKETITMAKDLILPLLANSIDESTFIIAPVKNGKTYDVKYTFGIKVDAFIGEIIKTLDGLDSFDTSSLPTELAEIFKMLGQIKETLKTMQVKTKDVVINVTINTTGNTQTKNVDASKDEPKYLYEGGKLTSFELKTTIKNEETNQDETIEVSGNIKLTNTIVPVTIPTEWEQETPNVPDINDNVGGGEQDLA